VKDNSFSPNLTFNKNIFFDEYYKKLSNKQRGPMDRIRTGVIRKPNGSGYVQTSEEIQKKPSMKKQHSYATHKSTHNLNLSV
jgi:hypothetical protein